MPCVSSLGFDDCAQRSRICAVGNRSSYSLFGRNFRLLTAKLLKPSRIANAEGRYSIAPMAQMLMLAAVHREERVDIKATIESIPVLVDDVPTNRKSLNRESTTKKPLSLLRPFQLTAVPNTSDCTCSTIGKSKPRA